MLRPAQPSDTPALLALAVSTGLFAPEEADALLRPILEQINAGILGADHRAHVCVDPSGAPLGWVYFSADPNASGVWELWWIGVTPERQGQGVGDELLRFVESHARAAGGRILLIATSSLPALERARRFYESRGYAQCGRIPDFYGEGDDKLTYAKKLASGPAPR